jgi:deazaflavin-dependent oxidoreductase (nitroreductase family)
MVTATLRRVDGTKRAGVFRRLYAAFATWRVTLFMSRHISWKLDPLLLRLTRGRLATTLMFPTAVLETVGARSGAPRRNAIIYFNDGESVVVAASNAGSAHNPAWYHNALANPDVVFGGIPMRATVVDDEAELNRLWAMADNVFPAFANYRRKAGLHNRTIPLVHLARR